MVVRDAETVAAFVNSMEEGIGYFAMQAVNRYVAPNLGRESVG